MDLRTNRQIKMDAIKEKVGSMYAELRALHPESSDNAIHSAIAKELKYTPNGIRRIVKSIGS